MWNQEGERGENCGEVLGQIGRQRRARATQLCQGEWRVSLAQAPPTRFPNLNFALFFSPRTAPARSPFLSETFQTLRRGQHKRKQKKTITPVLFGHVGREKIFCREIVTIAGELDDNRNPRSGSLGLFPEPVLISALFSTPLSTFAHIKLELGPRIIPRAIGKMPSEIIYNVISELFRFSHIIPATVYFPQTSKFASEKDFSELFFS